MEANCVPIGAGQGGLTVAARLKQLGVNTLIIDRNPRIGDNWRNRYHQLVLHDPVWYDHLPYVPFPPNWPVCPVSFTYLWGSADGSQIFTPKDKLAEWFETYAKTMELNVWTSTSITDSSWDEDKRQWTVTVKRTRDGKEETRKSPPRSTRTLRPNRVHR